MVFQEARIEKSIWRIYETTKDNQPPTIDPTSPTIMQNQAGIFKDKSKRENAKTQKRLERRIVRASEREAAAIAMLEGAITSRRQKPVYRSDETETEKPKNDGLSHSQNKI
ncbi:hypothetical protein YC2023_015756 [Brassica napus]